MKRPNGYILYRNDIVTAIVTGLEDPSKNTKTGDMLQVWILRRDRKPNQAAMDGSDSAICGDCPFRYNPVDGMRECYVDVSKAPRSVWDAYQNNRYPELSPDQYASVFSGRKVRFGAYGEPTRIPFPIVKAIAEVAKGHTGYTHDWRNPLYQSYKQYLMASCDESDYREAQAMGWRTFTVTQDDIRLDKQVLCPASKQAGHRTNCEHCLLCGGISKTARSITIPKH